MPDRVAQLERERDDLAAMVGHMRDGLCRLRSEVVLDMDCNHPAQDEAEDGDDCANIDDCRYHVLLQMIGDALVADDPSAILAARDERMKREGAAEELAWVIAEINRRISIAPAAARMVDVRTLEMLRNFLGKRAAELRPQTTTTNLATAEAELTGGGPNA